MPDQIAGAEVIKLEVPTVFGKGPQKTVDAIEEFHPDYVLCIGQAGGRSQITPEFVGINYVQARIPDNEGNQPMNQPLVEGAPAAYFATIPVHAMVEEMKKAGIPASVSFTAGTYVCNAMLYCVMHALATKHPTIKGGFMHVPYLKDLGADITVKNQTATIIGPRKLIGTSVVATDLRAGAAMVTAGLIAEGTTTITNVEHILRGYEQIVEKLTSVGAKITIKEI